MNEGGAVMNKESLLQAFYQEIHGADETAFQKAACSFMNLWDYEYGCLDGLPDQADRLIGQIVHEDLLLGD